MGHLGCLACLRSSSVVVDSPTVIDKGSSTWQLFKSQYQLANITWNAELTKL